MDVSRSPIRLPLPAIKQERPVERWPIVVIVLAAVLTIIGWTLIAGPLRTAFDGIQQPPVQSVSVKVPEDLPAVEPLELKNVSTTLAQEINAKTPFTREPIPPAAPFYLSGSAFDRDRATDCLASAIWYEAGAESLAGKKAVAQVVLNRVRHPAFPKSICGVVYQGSERSTGCQFTFTCDGAMRNPPTVSGWANARGLARIMLTGEVFKPVGTATHYHTDWVLPAWSAKLDKVHKEASHLFFRWLGWWGTPPAFRGKYAGTEPAISKLSALSPVHAASRPEDVTLTGDLTALLGPDGEAGIGAKVETGLPANPYGLKPVLQSPSADFLVFVVPKSADPGMLLSLVLFSCSVKPYCKVLVWTDARSAPTQMPVSEDQLDSMAFSYLRNRASGLDKALWNCEVFSRPDQSQCMKSRATAPAPIASKTSARTP